MTELSNGLFNTTDYTISEFVLYTSDGNSVDMRHIIVELNIYEDIFASTMSGDVVFSDTKDILSNFAVHGNEWLSISVDKPGLDNPIKKAFRIYKVSDKIYGTGQNVNYTFHFCSEETILAPGIRFSKSYKGMLISDMIRDIAVNYLRIPQSRLFIEATEGVFDIIIPNMDPFQAINWLSTRAYAKNKSVFMFFETRDGYIFSSFETMKNQPSFAKYTKSPKTTDDPSKNQTAISYMNGMEEFNILKGLRYGAYSSVVAKFDMVNRNYSMNTYSAYDYRDNNGMLNKGMLVNDTTDRMNSTLYQKFFNTYKFIINNDSDPTTNPTNYQHWLGPTISKLGQLTNSKLIVVIPGEILLRAGNKVEIEIPTMVGQTEQFDKNPYKSGFYLVSAVHHRYTGTIFTTQLELLTDSLAEYLPTPLNQSPLLSEIKKS